MLARTKVVWHRAHQEGTERILHIAPFQGGNNAKIEILVILTMTIEDPLSSGLPDLAGPVWLVIWLKRGMYAYR